MAACCAKPGYQIGDYLLPSGSSDPTKIIKITSVTDSTYKVFTHFLSEGRLVVAEDYHVLSRSDVDSKYKRVEQPNTEGKFSPDKFLSKRAASAAAAPSAPSSSTSRTDSPQLGTEFMPLVVTVKTLSEPSQVELAQRAAEGKEKSESDSALVKLTGAIAIATTALVVATAFLWAATRRLVLDTKEHSERQLRAYISVDTEHMTDPGGETVPNRHGFVIKNHGQTPAQALEHWTQIGVSEFPRKRDFESPKDNRLVIKTVVHSGNDRFIIVDLSLLREELAAIEAGTHALYAWGCVNYADVFGKWHATNFCFFINKDAVALQRWAHYKYGNDAT